MMMHSTSRKIDMFEVEIKDLSERFQLKSEASKVEREILLSLPNPNYEEFLKQHHELRNIIGESVTERTRFGWIFTCH